MGHFAAHEGDFSHECVDITGDDGISGRYVTRLLDRPATFRSYPLLQPTTGLLKVGRQDRASLLTVSACPGFDLGGLLERFFIIIDID